MQQMGRRGRGERAWASVSSDAVPALTGRRRVGAGQSGRGSGKQGGTAGNVFSVLAPPGGVRLFLLEESPMKRTERRWRP